MKARAGARWTLTIGAILTLIVVPFLLFGEGLEHWAVGAVQQLSERPGAVSVFVAGLLAADVFLPIPSSLVSTAAGALLGPWLGTAASFAGMTAGCGIGYWLGRSLGSGAESRWLTAADLARLNALAARHGPWLLVVARPLPVLAEASVVLAGMGAMPLRRFVPQVALSNLGISAVYAIVGAYAAGRGSFLLAFAGAVLLPLVVMTLLRQRNRRRT